MKKIFSVAMLLALASTTVFANVLGNETELLKNDHKYSVKNYVTEKLILIDLIDNSHVKSTNAYINYADAISIDNSKRFVELFNVTDENVKLALEKAKSNPQNEYAKLYSEIYNNDKVSGIYGNALKQFLELAIYSGINKNLIDKQISEFNEKQKKQYAQIAYNTKIVANLYRFASKEINLNLLGYSKNANSWGNNLKIESNIYNVNYKELCNNLSKNKIEFHKPTSFANQEQVSESKLPDNKVVDDKKIIDLVQAKGYCPKRIDPLSDTQIEAMEPLDALNLLIKNDNELFDYAEKNNNNIDGIFDIFYENTKKTVNLIFSKCSENYPHNSNEDTVTVLGIEFTDDKITNPETNIGIFIFSPMADAEDVNINHKYLYNRYKKHLDESWKDYLKIMSEEDKREYTMTANPEDVNYIINTQNFIAKHPNFSKNKEIQEGIKDYTTYILCNDFAYSADYGEFGLHRTKKIVEDLLDRADKNSEEYKVVKECYEELKENKFNTTAKFYKLLYEYYPTDLLKSRYEESLNDNE